MSEPPQEQGGMPRSISRMSSFVSEMSASVSGMSRSTISGMLGGTDETELVEDHDEVAYINPLLFKHFIAVVILLNVVQLGICTQFKESLPRTCFWAEVIFVIVFALEFILKIRVQSTRYFKSKWNLLDVVLVISGFINVFIMPHVDDADCNHCEPLSNSQSAIVRLVRLSREFRLLRVLRLNRQLQILVEGLVSSLKAMFWVALLLGLIIYAGSIFAFSSFNDKKKGFTWTDENGDSLGYFDTLGKSMLTLFDVAILDLWGDLVRPLEKAGRFDAVFSLIFYIFIASFGTLNLIIGIIAEATAKAGAEHENRDLERRKHADMQRITEAVQNLFLSVDQGDGLLTAKELEKADPDAVQAMLQGTMLPRGFSLFDLHLMCSSESGITEKDLIDGMKRIVFCNQFERDCILQHGMNSLKRHIKAVEKNQADMKILMEKIHDQLLCPNTLQSTTDHLLPDQLPCPNLHDQLPCPNILGQLPCNNLHDQLVCPNEKIDYKPILHDEFACTESLHAEFGTQELLAKIDQLVAELYNVGRALKESLEEQASLDFTKRELDDRLTIIEGAMEWHVQHASFRSKDRRGRAQEQVQHPRRSAEMSTGISTRLQTMNTQDEGQRAE